MARMSITRFIPVLFCLPAVAEPPADPLPYLSGPGVPACAPATSDGDLDLEDVAAWQREVSAAGHASLVEQLRRLPPLPRVHYCWPPERQQLRTAGPLLAEYVRIAGALGIRGEWWGASFDGNAELLQAVKLCAPYNAAIAVNYSPWHRVVTDPDPRAMTEKHTREVQLYRDSLIAIRDRLALINLIRETDVTVTVLLLDSERYRPKPDGDPDAKQWNAALDRLYAPFFRIGKVVFPRARVEWLSRGQDYRFTGNEAGDGYSLELYRVHQPERNRAAFVALRDSVPTHTVMPWVALGAGYQPSGWSRRLDYPLEFSRQLGADLNRNWIGVEAVTFFPGPFHPKYPLWADHFIAYVQGGTIP